MGKKQIKKQKIVLKQNPTANLQKSQSVIFDKKTVLWIAGILTLTAAVYFPVFSNDLIGNWDDGTYIIMNDVVKSINLKNIFSAFYGGNYHPFVALTNAIEYHFFETQPFIYHFNNLIFHLLNTFLVFVFIRKLTNTFSTAIIVSLFFGIHPMHVESVAWASERKDVLYAFFFLLSLIQYLKYITESENKKKFYIYSILFFLFSLFSKSAATVLPLVLLLIDWFYSRKINMKILLEKAPFFALSLTFGIIALFSQKTAMSSDNINRFFAMHDRIFFACYSIYIYFYKMFIPLNLSVVYPYSGKVNGMLPSIFYISFFIVLALTVVSYFSLRKTKYLVFGFLFFLITIVLVLQLIPVGGFILAERYVYIPYIGTFLIVGAGISNVICSKHPFVSRFRTPVIIVVAAGAVFFSVLSFKRVKVWENGYTLFSDAAAKSPTAMSFGNIGYYFYLKNDFPNALEYYTKSLSYDTNSANTLRMRGVVYFNLNMFKESIRDLDKAIKFDPSHKDAYLARGNDYSRLGMFKESIPDYDKYISISPQESNPYLYRGIAHFNTGNTQEAINDFNTCLKYAPDNIQALMNLGILYHRSQNPVSIEYFSRIIQLNPKNSEAYSWRGLSYQAVKETEKAINDYTSAIAINPNDVVSIYNRAHAYREIGRHDLALADAKRAAALGQNVDLNLFSGKQ